VLAVASCKLFELLLLLALSFRAELLLWVPRKV
jgi:hypothetical protein